MTITTLAKEATRMEVGKALLTLKTQATNALNQLQQCKANAEALKQRTVDEDAFTQADTDEIQAAIDATIAEADTIFQGIKIS